MRAVIVEDETAAAENLIALIREVAPGTDIAAVLESVDDSVAWLAGNPLPDLIFMDIHLADGDAFRIFSKTEVPAPVIFTTAYDRYALEAFKVNSIDYLLKPIKSEELHRAFRKLELLTGSERKIHASHIAAAATAVDEHIRKQKTFLVHVKDKLLPLKAREVAFFFTLDEKVHAYTFDSRRLQVDGSLDSIMGSLDEKEFFRANRQFIVSREAVRDISVWFGSRLCINLCMETPERIIVSKARVPEFKRWMRGD